LLLPGWWHAIIDEEDTLSLTFERGLLLEEGETFRGGMHTADDGQKEQEQGRSGDARTVNGTTGKSGQRRHRGDTDRGDTGGTSKKTKTKKKKEKKKEKKSKKSKKNKTKKLSKADQRKGPGRAAATEAPRAPPPSDLLPSLASLSAQLLLAQKLTMKGEHGSAEAVYRRLLLLLQPASTESTSQEADIWFNLGVITAGTGRLAEAEAAYKRAIALRPATMVEAHSNLAVVYAMGQPPRYQEAGDAIASALSLEPAHAEALANRRRLMGLHSHRDDL
jgi:tetratricopeptide (TPR) repeat protein